MTVPPSGSSGNVSAGDAPDMMSIGVHCDHPDCRQLDFLPFKCGCGNTFCLEHRMPSNHKCTKAQDSAEQQIVVCPVCAMGVKVREGEDPNVIFERHSRTDCDPSNYARVHKKRKCPVPNCREKLTTINSFTCKDCCVTVCLKHRLATDHACPGRPAAAASAASSRFAAFRSMFSNNPARQPPRQAPAAARPPQKSSTTAGTKQKAANVVKTASNNVQSQLQQYRDRHRTATLGGPPATPNGPEVCSQCNARFATVQQLIDHAAAVHQDGWNSGSVAVGPGSPAARDGLERCPHCGQGFADPVALVNHVERNCAQRPSSATECVLC